MKKRDKKKKIVCVCGRVKGGELPICFIPMYVGQLQAPPEVLQIKATRISLKKKNKKDGVRRRVDNAAFVVIVVAAAFLG